MFSFPYSGICLYRLYRDLRTGLMCSNQLSGSFMGTPERNTERTFKLILTQSVNADFWNWVCRHFVPAATTASGFIVEAGQHLLELSCDIEQDIEGQQVCHAEFLSPLSQVYHELILLPSPTTDHRQVKSVLFI